MADGFAAVDPFAGSHEGCRTGKERVMTTTFLSELKRLKAQEVIRISDRKHDAWDAAKAALDKLNGGKS